jgi:cytochrome c oxidase subunit 2
MFQFRLAPRAWLLAASSVIVSGVSYGYQETGLRAVPPRDISVDGHRIDELFMTVTWLIAALFVAMTIILIICATRFRWKPGVRAAYEKGDTRKDAVIATVFSLVIFLGVDGTLLINSHHDVNEVFWKFPEQDRDVLRVEVLAQQWAWNFRYAGKDGQFNTDDDIVTLNDFRVPENRKVLCQITSKDVIHSFSLPFCRIKRDANPGEITRLWFATKPGTAGEYQVACAQMCGYAHYMMQARMHVLTDDQWNKWTQEAATISELPFKTMDKQQQDKILSDDQIEQYRKWRADVHWGWEWKPAPSPN